MKLLNWYINFLDTKRNRIIFGIVVIVCILIEFGLFYVLYKINPRLIVQTIWMLLN